MQESSFAYLLLASMHGWYDSDHAQWSFRSLLVARGQLADDISTSCAMGPHLLKLNFNICPATRNDRKPSNAHTSSQDYDAFQLDHTHAPAHVILEW